MQLRVDGSRLTYTSAQLRALADAVRDLSDAVRRAGAAVLDVDLDAGLQQVAGVSSDVLDLIAADLSVVATALRSGEGHYTQVEGATAAAASATVPAQR